MRQSPVSTEDYLRLAPKAELHVHLEGSIQPATLLTLAERNGIELPATTVEGLREWFTYRDFAHFVDIYVAVTRCLRRREDYALITYELGRELARQNVRYAEVTFTPATHHLRFGVPHDVYFPGLTEGRRQARDDFGVELRWVFDIVHLLSDDALHRRQAEYTTSVAIESREDGVVALGLGGIEIGHSFERIAPYFDRARAAGLHAAPHAGETVGPESIWGAINVLGAERIGHGVRATEDPELVRHLAEHRIPLEVCPTSNIRLGVYPNLAAHPLRALYDAGVIVTVNSDDPPLFNTTLNQEYSLLNGIRHSFMEEAWKQEQEEAFRAELAQLKRDTLVD